MMLVAGSAASAQKFFIIIAGPATPPASDTRVTDTGDTRVTDTGDTRITQ